MSNITKDEEQKILNLWESMFGNNAYATSEPFVVNYQDFIAKVKQYGLEQRIDEQSIAQNIWNESDLGTFAALSVKRQKELTALKQQLTPESEK